MLYFQPKLPRAGISNMLIVWATCYAQSLKYNARFIDPNWFKLRLGVYTRGERDKRSYHRYFISSLSYSTYRLFISIFSVKLNSEDFKTDVHSLLPVVVNFKTMNSLNLCVDYRKEIALRLMQLTRKEFLPDIPKRKFIGIHVRLGDFKDSGDVYYRTPLSWYIKMLKEIRREFGDKILVLVFSDGSDFELHELLQEENVVRSPYNEAITDILLMSNSLLLLASRSSFSLFSSFLGHVPVVWWKGHDIDRHNGQNVIGFFSPECGVSSHESIPSDFLNMFCGWKEKD